VQIGGPIPSNGLIVIARVRPGSEERLRATLNRIGNDVKGKRLKPGVTEAHIDFPSSRTIHFARLALLDDPDSGPKRKRLLLATDYDGRWRDHVMELFALTSLPEEIWGCCEGYTGRWGFPAFIRRNTVKPQAYYIAFRGLSLGQIRLLNQLRQHSTAPPGSAQPTPSQAAERILNDLLRLPVTGLNVLGMLVRRGPFHTLRAAKRVNATLDRIWWAKLFNRLTLNRFSPPPTNYSQAPVDALADCTPATPEDEVSSNEAWEGTPGEDLVSQNQLTLVTVVRPEQLDQLHAVLEVIDLYARRLAEQGSLAGIQTIHTVRWALLDGGKRLLLASNYDGTWESYIAEFAELILSGLDAIWEGSYGFPELGAPDVAAFKNFLRCHQAPANVFYSAYPTATVPNIVDAIQIAHDWAKRL
jgi:hypothetical protein